MERVVRLRSTGEIITVNEAGQKVGGPYASVKIAKQTRNRREKDSFMKSMGLTKVRGNLGGTYWE